MNDIRVSCLTATHGRFSALRVALACFLCQDVPIEQKEIIILNAHPISLNKPSWIRPDMTNIRIYNEPEYKTLGDCRNRLIQLARGEFCRTWDDDDLYLPDSLKQGLGEIGDAPAFKPLRSWSAKGYKEYDLIDNVFEAAMLVRTEVAKKYGYGANTGGDEHTTLLQGIEKDGGCKRKDFGSYAAYAYNWATPLWRISGSLGSAPVDVRTMQWKIRNQDTGDGAALEPDFLGMSAQFKALVADAPRTIGEPAARALALSLGDFL
jgi:hypothetical protein